jgi:hypothetical protein
MNDRESEFARRVVRRLDAGAADLRPGTLYRLQQARAAALAGAPARARAAGAELATAGTGGGSPGRSRAWTGPAGWLAVALVVTGIAFGYQQWHAVQQVREFEELDLNLLASDLPIDAYLDRGFQNWLRTAFER